MLMHPSRGSDKSDFAQESARRPRQQLCRASTPPESAQCFGRANLSRLMNSARPRSSAATLIGGARNFSSRAGGAVRLREDRLHIMGADSRRAPAMRELRSLQSQGKQRASTDKPGEPPGQLDDQAARPILPRLPAGLPVDRAIPRSRCKDNRRSLSPAGRAEDAHAPAWRGRIFGSRGRKREDFRTGASSSPRAKVASATKSALRPSTMCETIVLRTTTGGSVASILTIRSVAVMVEQRLRFPLVSFQPLPDDFLIRIVEPIVLDGSLLQTRDDLARDLDSSDEKPFFTSINGSIRSAWRNIARDAVEDKIVDVRLELMGVHTELNADTPELDGNLIGNKLTLAGIVEKCLAERGAGIDRAENIAACAMEKARESFPASGPGFLCRCPERRR